MSYIIVGTAIAVVATVVLLFRTERKNYGDIRDVSR